MDIRIAHSPDSDDAFMFYALAANMIPTGSFSFSHTLEDIETLNRKALSGEYEVTAVSIHAYAFIAEKYQLLPSGASMGDGYGPIVVTTQNCADSELRGKRIGVPGTMTTAYLTLKLFQPEFEPVVIRFDRIMDAVLEKSVDAGLLIHEGQLTYADEGLHKVADLGEWWLGRTGLPLPLGGNAIRRDLGAKAIREISRLLKDSIRYGLEHREEALQHAGKYARGLDPGQADRFVSMYVNEWTLDYGERGRRAVQLLLDEGFAAGLLPHRISVEFAE